MATQNNQGKIVGDEKRISYFVKEVLGSGAGGKVFAGKFDEQNVAVKRVDKHDIPEYMTFLSEVNLVKKCNHKNTVKYYYHDSDEEYYYIALERCRFSLRGYFENQKNQKRGVSKAKGHIIMHQSACGLEYLHSQKIIHRDIKPGNILLAEVGEGRLLVKITDFGVSRQLDPGKTSTSASIGGTRGYWASEAIKGLRIRRESDVFSLGIIFYEILSEGMHPFGETRLDHDYNIKSRNEPALVHIPDDEFKKFISRMLVHESNRRPSAAKSKDAVARSFCDLVAKSGKPIPNPRVLLPLAFLGDNEEDWHSFNWSALYDDGVMSKAGSGEDATGYIVDQGVFKTPQKLKRRSDQPSHTKEIKQTKTEKNFHEKAELNSQFKTYAQQGYNPDRSFGQSAPKTVTERLGSVEHELLNGSIVNAIETAKKVFEELVTPSVRPHVGVVYRCAEECLGTGQHEIRAVLLFMCASALYKFEEAKTKRYEGIANCIEKVATAVRDTVREGADARFQSITKRFILPNMCLMLEALTITQAQQTNRFKELKAYGLDRIASTYHEIGEFKMAIERANEAMKISDVLPLAKSKKSKLLNSLRSIIASSESKTQ